MTDKRTVPDQAASVPADMDEEACRRLMIFLCGGEAEAASVAQVLLRDATPEEAKLVAERYAIGDELARQKARELGYAPHPRLAEEAKGGIAPLSTAELKEFESFMQKIYLRLEKSEEEQSVAAEADLEDGASEDGDVDEPVVVPPHVAAAARFKIGATFSGIRAGFGPAPTEQPQSKPTLVIAQFELDGHSYVATVGLSGEVVLQGHFNRAWKRILVSGKDFELQDDGQPDMRRCIKLRRTQFDFAVDAYRSAVEAYDNKLREGDEGGIFPEPPFSFSE